VAGVSGDEGNGWGGAERQARQLSSSRKGRAGQGQGKAGGQGSPLPNLSTTAAPASPPAQHHPISSMLTRVADASPRVGSDESALLAAQLDAVHGVRHVAAAIVPNEAADKQLDVPVDARHALWRIAEVGVVGWGSTG